MSLVTVTGASGFIAAHAVEQLLSKGYAVRATVRNPAKTKGVFQSANLELVEADLLAGPEAFRRAVTGASCVMHLASPYVLNVEDPQKDLVDPAVRGTLNVLEACAREPGIRRVVLTSSMAAITDEPDSAHVLTEADWNTKSSLTRNPYYFSKAEAERAAWEFIKRAKPGFDLVTINPFLVIGPSLTPGLNASNQVLADIVKGAYPGILNIAWGLVDVRDVALAHILAMETATAAGRYLCAADVITMREVVGIQRDAGYGKGTKLPTLGLDHEMGNILIKLASYTLKPGVGSYLRTHIGRTPRYDNGKIQRELGLRFRNVRESIVEAMSDMVRWGHLAAPQ